ncbi:MAG: ferrous iron transport protein A [Tissierella sp.]|nr:ferrous iron transport protein A [Tissierella sp.]
MKGNLIPLDKLPIGSQCIVEKLLAEGIIRRRMMDLGLINGTLIKSLMKSPSGDPIAYEIRGTKIALRSEEASKVLVMQI